VHGLATRPLFGTSLLRVPEPTELSFRSGDETCAAWRFDPPGPAGSRPCVVMGHGFSLTRHDSLARYAERLAAAGAVVLVFDYRHLGDSGGEPRQHFRTPLQLQDWRAAVLTARALPGVDPARIVLWGFSFGGSHAVATTAVAGGRVAATIALCPFLDGLARVLATPPGNVARLVPKAAANLCGARNTVPVTGPPGAWAAMTLPGEADGFAATVPADSPWRNEIAPGLFLTLALHRTARLGRKIPGPLWVGLGTRDVTVSGAAIRRLATQAPAGELHTYPEDHFSVFRPDAVETIATDQIAFLQRSGLLTG
jgi:pimeloyl-ACP methyl ester carboxylesterase